MDYLPKGEGIPKQFGGFNVTVKQITEKSDFVETILSITNGKVRKHFSFFLSNVFFFFPHCTESKNYLLNVFFLFIHVIECCLFTRGYTLEIHFVERTRYA